MQVTGFCFVCDTIVQVEKRWDPLKHSRLLICPKCGSHDAMGVLNDVTLMMLHRIEAIEQILGTKAAEPSA